MSRHSLSVRGQGELKRRARPDVAGSRKSSPVRFDDRTADRKSHAHAAGLGSEEGVEQLVGVLGVGQFVNSICPAASWGEASA